MLLSPRRKDPWTFGLSSRSFQHGLRLLREHLRNISHLKPGCSWRQTLQKRLLTKGPSRGAPGAAGHRDKPCSPSSPARPGTPGVTSEGRARRQSPPRSLGEPNQDSAPSTARAAGPWKGVFPLLGIPSLARLTWLTSPPKPYPCMCTPKSQQRFWVSLDKINPVGAQRGGHIPIPTCPVLLQQCLDFKFLPHLPDGPIEGSQRKLCGKAAVLLRLEGRSAPSAAFPGRIHPSETPGPALLTCPATWMQLFLLWRTQRSWLRHKLAWTFPWTGFP